MEGCIDKDRGLYGRLPRYIRTGDYMAGQGTTVYGRLRRLEQEQRRYIITYALKYRTVKFT